MPKQTIDSFITRTKKTLEIIWTKATETKQSESEKKVPKSIADAVRKSINSKTKSYRYVLPTQLLAKLVNPNLDCRCVQEGCSLAGAFDARTLCKEVIVEFDRAHHGVLGGSGDPYVNNPLRIEAVLPKYQAAQRDGEGFGYLCNVLQFAQENPKMLPWLLAIVSEAIYERLQHAHVTYPVPNRVSLEQTQCLFEKFLKERTGGTRLQAVSAAIFETIGKNFGLYDHVENRHINAADSQTGNAADLECLSKDGIVVMAVEVKDRQLTLTDVQDKLQSVRAKGVRELLYLVRGGSATGDQTKIAELSRKEFSTGQNMYVCEFNLFAEACLILLGEKGRRTILQQIGEELDLRADLQHRETWRDLLKEI